MRFSLQDVKKSVQRRGGELTLSPHFLLPGELHSEIARLIDYHERMLSLPQRQFSFEEARACIGDYRLANCLIATLSFWYSWRQRDWQQAVQEKGASPAEPDLASPVQLRLALYNYVNEHYRGFLDAQAREQALQTFAARYQLDSADLEYLLALDSEEEALLVREAPLPPAPQDVATLYNQWTFEAVLFNASSVNFVIDPRAFASAQAAHASSPGTGSGLGAVIKRLAFLARKLGVYYDLSYDPSSKQQLTHPLLTLTLYGPQEMTGTPQQYGQRLARLCRLLLGYSDTTMGRRKRSSLTVAIVEAGATVHFLQRSYRFVMDSQLLQLLPPPHEIDEKQERIAHDTATLFDSGIERSFADAFASLASSRGVDGWQLEREPEPLLLEESIFIPDFALTRAGQRVYVEILGFWTPSYRERKIQKLQQLQQRDDLVLAIPAEARAAFAEIAAHFPIAYYNGQLSVTELLHLLRSHYDDFADRLTRIDVSTIRTLVEREGLLPERDCYEALYCYRRSELQHAAERVTDGDIVFQPGLGLYDRGWLLRLKQMFMAWIEENGPLSLVQAINQLKVFSSAIRNAREYDSATLESILPLWPEVRVRRDSIFEAVVELGSETGEAGGDAMLYEMAEPVREAHRQVRERRNSRKSEKKRPAPVQEQQNVQGGLWDE